MRSRFELAQNVCCTLFVGLGSSPTTTSSSSSFAVSVSVSPARSPFASSSVEIQYVYESKSVIVVKRRSRSRFFKAGKLWTRNAKATPNTIKGLVARQSHVMWVKPNIIHTYLPYLNLPWLWIGDRVQTKQKVVAGSESVNGSRSVE